MSAEQNVTESPVETYVDRSSGEDAAPSQAGNGSYELDEDGQRIPHGMGQSKSSRRRRRKRKNKGAGTGENTAAAPGNGATSGENGFDPATAGAVAPIAVLPGESLALAQNAGGRSGQVRAMQAGAAQPSGQFNGNGNGNGQNAGNVQGTKRWKKKFRDRDRRGAEGNGNGSYSNGSGSNGQAGGGGSMNVFRGPDTHQPGNSVLGGGKRKGSFSGGKSQRQGGGGGRSFVGPMDHSYRAVNGNVFETPPATIDPYGNSGGGGRPRSYQSDAQPIDYSQGRPIPIPADAPTRIYFFIEDLFFTAKIQETARKLGVKVAFIKNEKEQIAALTAGGEEERPGLIVFDLNNANAKPMTLIPKLKAKLKKQTSIVGFLSHLQGDLKAKAVEAGCDTVMPRAAFSQNLPNLLRRYGIEEVDEPNFNQ